MSTQVYAMVAIAVLLFVLYRIASKIKEMNGRPGPKGALLPPILFAVLIASLIVILIIAALISS